MLKSNLFRFILIFFCSYFILLGLHEIKLVRKVHTGLFTSLEQVVFNVFHPTIKTDFEFYQKSAGLDYRPDKFDFSIKIFNREALSKNRRAKPMNILNASLDNIAIGPFILLLSLIIATPTHWKRKLLSFIIGLILIYILTALKYSKLFAENIESLAPRGLWGGLTNLYGNSLKSHEFILINVLLFWALLSIRKKELNWFLN